ncbi:MAG: hypothetical protein PHH75_04785 [Candidatus Omnitrophica bacterium]|nr:hypothetical protein [Candidatus Omnitrophota bacterium]MDD5574477.1 hypothetical protein [Candidatus Omnitrophota bacterium]
MRRTAALFLCLVLCGCIQSKEHLSFQADGTGTLEVHLMVPEGTITLIDSTMGNMMQGMAQAFGGGKDVQMPASLAEEMFSSQDEMFKKAKKAGLNITFKSFSKNIRDKNLYVDYTIGFDDVNKLLKSGLMMAHVGLARDDQGRMVAFMKKNEKKAKESRGQVAAAEAGEGTAPQKEGRADTAEEKEMKDKIEKAMSQFSVELRLTMPTPIQEVTGIFVKENENTVAFSLKGDLFKDKTLIDKYYGTQDDKTEAIASAEGISFALPTLAEAMAQEPQGDAALPMPSGTAAPEPSSAGTEEKPSLDEVLEKTGQADTRLKDIPMGTRVKVSFKDGETVEGRLVARTSDYIRVDSIGIPMTYFIDTIWEVKETGSGDAGQSK